MFQFPGFAFNPLWIQGENTFLMTSVSPKLAPRTNARDPSACTESLEITLIESGFPHSEICGSKVVRTSPQLIAAYHVLHRLSMPRHPPNALMALDHSHRRCSLIRVHRQGKTSLLHRHRVKTRTSCDALWVASGSEAGGDNLLTMTNSNASPHSGDSAKPRSFSGCILVEPDGIEPTT
jgi:Cft2 family RNA processing exonuclease